MSERLVVVVVFKRLSGAVQGTWPLESKRPSVESQPYFLDLLLISRLVKFSNLQFIHCKMGIILSPQVLWGITEIIYAKSLPRTKDIEIIQYKIKYSKIVSNKYCSIQGWLSDVRGFRLFFHLIPYVHRHNM